MDAHWGLMGVGHSPGFRRLWGESGGFWGIGRLLGIRKLRILRKSGGFSGKHKASWGKLEASWGNRRLLRACGTYHGLLAATLSGEMVLVLQQSIIYFA